MNLNRQIGLLLGGLALSFFAACDFVPPRPTVSEPQPAEETENADDNLSHTLQASTPLESPKQLKANFRIAGEPLDEYWDEYHIGGQKAGYSHTVIEVLAEPEGRFDRRITFVDNMRVRRGQDTLEQRFEQVSIESRLGEVKTFSSTLSVGDQETRFAGRFEEGRLLLETAQGEQVSRQALPLPKNAKGSLAVSQSLRDRPIRENETRTLQVLLPIQYVFGRVELTAHTHTPVPLADQSTEDLLEIESVTYVGDAELLRQTLWMNDDGEILKSYVPAFDLTTLRSNERDATYDSGQLVDLLAATRVPLSKRMPVRAEEVRVRVRHKNVPPGEFIPSTEYQQVLPTGRFTAEVTISREPTGTSRKPTAADKEPSALIESDDAQIVKFAEHIAEVCESDDLFACFRDATHNQVGIKNFSRGFATAAEVMRESVGDCTEHSVLLAALLRAKGIPAQVAAGLVQTETEDGMAMVYHMWTLAWDGEHWQILDATFGKVPIGTDRIEIVRSNLSSNNPYEALLPVLRPMGQISVEVIP